MTSATSGSSDGGSSGFPECQCDAIEVDFEEQVEGLSAAEALEPLLSTTLSITWVGFEDSPIVSTAELQLEYLGGPISHGEGGFAGCDFIGIDCPDGFTFEVGVLLTTPDGMAIGSFVAELDLPAADVAEFARPSFWADDVQRDTFEGRITETLYYEGDPLTGTDLLEFWFQWEAGGESLHEGQIRVLSDTTPYVPIAFAP